MTEFRNGSIVRLKSGGPKMTVNAQGSANSFHCSWFRKKRLCNGTFSAEALKTIKPAKGVEGPKHSLSPS